jgi:hypothetical protein
MTRFDGPEIFKNEVSHISDDKISRKYVL